MRAPEKRTPGGHRASADETNEAGSIVPIAQPFVQPTSLRFFGPDNQRGLPADLRAVVQQVARLAIHHHGLDPCTKGQAAAHEAGHVVVAWALGGTIQIARITPQRAGERKVWLGRNQHTGLPGDDGQPVVVSEAPDSALMIAAVNLAGFAGEELAGLSHPASSIDERVKAQATCDALDGVRELPTGTHAMRLTLLVGNILARHRRAFDAIRAHLAAHRMLTPTAAARMLGLRNAEGTAARSLLGRSADGLEQLVLADREGALQ